MEQTMMEMGEFPHEVIKEILDRLLKVVNPNRITRDGQTSWQKEFRSAIRFRRVCSVWRDLIDEILEASVVSMIRGWLPNRWLFDLLPNAVSNIIIRPTLIHELEQKSSLFIPSYIVNNVNTIRYPGKCLIVASHYPCVTYNGIDIAVNELVLKSVKCLSVLCLSNSSLNFDVFVTILQAANNLKVLILKDFQVILKDDDQIQSLQLPDLPKLTTLMQLQFFRLYNNNIANEKQDSSHNPIRNVWLFNGYVNQLVNVEIICWRTLDISHLLALTQLSLITPSFYVLPQIAGSNKLAKLSISSINVSLNHMFGTIKGLFEFVDQFSNTLVELYLDISWRELGFVESNNHEHMPPSKNELPRVYKLTLGCPNFDNEKQMLIQHILPKFPILEELVIVSYEKMCYPYPIYYSQKNPVLYSSNDLDMYWHKCRMLRQISMLRHLQSAYTLLVLDSCMLTYARPVNV